MISTLLTPLDLYYTPVRYSLSSSSIHHAIVSYFFPSLVVPPGDISRLSFDSVIDSLGSQLASWIGDVVNHYLLETSIQYCRVAPYLPARSSIPFTTLSNFYHNLNRLRYSRTDISTLTFRIKICAYRVSYFSNGHQICQYFDHYGRLILDSYVYHKKYCCRINYIQEYKFKNNPSVRHT